MVRVGADLGFSRFPASLGTLVLAIIFGGRSTPTTMRGGRRVVITGIGVVSPIGIGKDAFWESLVAGKSGVDYVSAFDASQYACKVAGEVKGFKATDFVSQRRTAIMGRFSQFALAATRLALEDAKLSITPDLSPRVGICYGTSVAGLDLVFSGFPDFLKGGVAAVKPWTALEAIPLYRNVARSYGLADRTV